ncbi:3-oxoacyl-[acyl-carrier protein] reductase [Leeuwenhoekiella aestuarii]|uniref:3-oxoacyl-[acyl-carrier protein] reductase n=1 Tax=Leeuwenhoekiella aestuarii TaxID=2249426 RepID=A0A4V1KNN2_9FLAO|nr:glucose 1-dehydrogenase [Leeuwenhoekiella aestuarii]RXG11213.1 3-oxoacyl-[acyl-carrier protein] reductase [Leeuwenhoekiella aestuarii]RXG11579.1 3-oxoacyl-[acyl-carrier protein] reductase [Leeuwenhoekiella aestuarii]
MKLKGKVAVITGSSKGIGAGIAKEFAREGASVVVNYSSSKEYADKVVDEIMQNGGTAMAVQADISNITDITKLFEETKKAYGSLDILVNNASVWRYEMLENISEESFLLQIRTGLMAHMFTSQQAVKMFGKEGGSIINLSSTISLNPIPGTLIYCAVKAGVDSIAKTLAKELGPKNIRVNTIAPGMTESEGSTADGRPGSAMEKYYLDQTPLGRIGLPVDIAKVAVFLASDEAAWVTGERISVSGGML